MTYLNVGYVSPCTEVLFIHPGWHREVSSEWFSWKSFDYSVMEAQSSLSSELYVCPWGEVCWSDLKSEMFIKTDQSSVTSLVAMAAEFPNRPYLDISLFDLKYCLE